MTLRGFLDLHSGGTCQCISIYQEPYNYETHRYKKVYFEEENQDEIIDSYLFRKICEKMVDHFSIIGGGGYPIELSIFLEIEGEQGHE